MHRATTERTAIRDGERLAYSVPEAARIVGISARRMWDRVRDNKIQSYREDNRRLISRRAIEEYVAAREAASAVEEVA